MRQELNTIRDTVLAARDANRFAGIGALRHALSAMRLSVRRKQDAVCQSASILHPKPDAGYRSLKTSAFCKSSIGIQFPGSRGQPAESGFTLLEILLAFLILSIVVTTILGSFNAVFSTTDTLENSGNYYNMAKSCLNRMKIDLEALYVTQPPFYKKPEFDDPPDNYRFVGSMEDIDGTSIASLRFASRAHIPFAAGDRGGIAEIVYYVQAQNDGRMVLRRSDHLYPYPQFEEKGSDPVLCRYVKSLAFKYIDADGEESETWNSDADDFDHATPTAIGIVLEIGTESETYTFETTVKLAVHRKKLE